MVKESKRTELRVCELGQKSLDKIGGVEVVVYELATRMAQLGLKVTCINRKGDFGCGNIGTEGNISDIEDVQILYAPTINGRGLAAVSSSFFASIMAAFGKYNVVHIHAEGPAFMCWLPKLFGKRVIVTVHGLDHQRAKWGRFASAYIMAGERNAVRFADEIIVLSDSVKCYFQEKYGRNTSVIPNGVSRPVIRSAKQITSKWNLREEDYILYLGRIVPEKGERYLIEAFKQIDTEKRLVIAGGSSDSDEFFEELKQLAKDDRRIIFTGFVQGEMLEELYSNAYIYTLPSDLEGMPLSLLEAMSYGNCCLTSDIPECKDVIQDKGVVFRQGNIDDLREKLQMLVDDAQLVSEYKSKAADYILRKYSWDYVVKETIELYRG